MHAATAPQKHRPKPTTHQTTANNGTADFINCTTKRFPNRQRHTHTQRNIAHDHNSKTQRPNLAKHSQLQHSDRQTYESKNTPKQCHLSKGNTLLAGHQGNIKTNRTLSVFFQTSRLRIMFLSRSNRLLCASCCKRMGWVVTNIAN